MKYAKYLLGLLLASAAGVAMAEERPLVIVVVGADGASEFAPQFRQWAERWQDAARKAQAECQTIGLEPATDQTDRETLKRLLAQQAEPCSEALWLVLIGHGTFDGKTAKFNLRGPDVTPAELHVWLKPVARPLAVIDCTSSSGPFVSELSARNRVVVAATRSGFEYNFARFGDYLSAAIVSDEADLDKDQQTSLFEAFLLAADRVREFYEADNRLMTEHAILDDNGDRLGTPADWFGGLRPVKEPPEGVALDGALARQFILLRGQLENQLPSEGRAQRDSLEQQLAELRRQKSQLTEAEYFGRLEPLLVEIARLYEKYDPLK